MEIIYRISQYIGTVLIVLVLVTALLGGAASVIGLSIMNFVGLSIMAGITLLISPPVHRRFFDK